MYTKAGYAERVEVAYSKVAQNVSLDNDSTPGATQIPLYKPPVCAGSQAGRTVELVLCTAWRRLSWDSLLSPPRQRDTVDQVNAYIFVVEWCWRALSSIIFCVEVWSPRHDFGSVLLSVRLQSRHWGYSAPGSGACIMHTPCSSSL